MTATLADRLRPCGPVTDAEAAGRALETLEPAAAAGGWSALLHAAQPALEPVFAAAPYLAGLATRDPDRLRRVLAAPAGETLDALVAEAEDADAAVLRRLKGDLHLLAALADLGGLWTLDEVTGALSRFADAAVRAALALAVEAERARGRLSTPAGAEEGEGPLPGLFVLALGKHGAGELNYSSDIDLSVFHDPAALPVAPGVEPERLALRVVQAMARHLSERTGDGYVFRTDLRLRPDPASTPVAAPVEAALAYYEGVGQNWERAALIKARPVAGDAPRAAAFLAALRPFIWRRHLDYAAVADVQAILRQIQSRAPVAAPLAAGADVKLGIGGIREIEFFVQTQQLILGGRRPDLRGVRTRDALGALERAGQVAPEVRAQLDADLVQLRAWEHRAQMLEDAQTHTLPRDDGTRARVAALSGLGLAEFDGRVGEVRAQVQALCGALFAQAEPLGLEAGPLVFTGVEDDPETLRTLAALGFAEPARVSVQVRAWSGGRTAATRTERGRELFTRLIPRLVEACAASGAPDATFARFADFFGSLASGVQVQSLFLGQPALFALVVRVLGLSPRLAAVLARQPAALDALLDPGFFAPLEAAAPARPFAAAAVRAGGFEAAMDAVRRLHREEAFRIGVQVLDVRAAAPDAGRAFAALADACLGALAPVAWAEVERAGGAFPGEVAVVALGKFGGREMTAGSDLDLMTVHRAAPDAVSAGRGWGAETVYARFTQRLVAALAAPTAEGGLYAVDLQLRPSGTSGPVAVSQAALESYYEREAQTWELLALTRARVAWATSAAYAADVAAALERALRRPRDPLAATADVRAMRALMARERPGRGLWDLKLGPGGLVDVEFAAQTLQLTGAARGGPLCVNTGDALEALNRADAAPAGLLDDLHRAWALQQALSQLLRLALEGAAPDPSGEPAPLRALLARAGGAVDFPALEAALADARARAHAAFEAVSA